MARRDNTFEQKNSANSQIFKCQPMDSCSDNAKILKKLRI